MTRGSEVGNDLDYLRELELVEFDKSYRGGTYVLPSHCLVCGFAPR